MQSLINRVKSAAELSISESFLRKVAMLDGGASSLDKALACVNNLDQSSCETLTTCFVSVCRAAFGELEGAANSQASSSVPPSVPLMQMVRPVEKASQLALPIIRLYGARHNKRNSNLSTNASYGTSSLHDVPETIESSVLEHRENMEQEHVHLLHQLSYGNMNLDPL